MNNLNERMKEVIALKTDAKDRFKNLEDLTGIPRTAWSNLLKGKQRATHEMIEMCCRLWKDWIGYITTGEGQKPILDMNEDAYQVISGEDYGVHLKRDASGKAMTNVRHSVNVQTRLNTAHIETDLINFEWGYVGKGCIELAGNILYMYRADKNLISRWAEPFCHEVIAALPHKEAYLSPTRIKDWIEDREKIDGEKTAAFNWKDALKPEARLQAEIQEKNAKRKPQRISELLEKNVNHKTN